MRQRTQTAEDAKLRTTLENMRYAACTPDDIKFLKTRIAGRRSDQPKLSDKEFRNVSIITALNAQKDRINELGSVRFAAETGQTLTDFYSIDRFGILLMLQRNNPEVEKQRHPKEMCPMK